jgi:glycosyltransferase involved in cell wall biosynthesis
MQRADMNTGAQGLVSIIIPLYNCRDYIGRCIESAVNQSYESIEIIIINDGSTDGSAEICRDWARADSRIRVIDSENYGPAKARNIGIEDSRGNLIFFMDADDFIGKNALELLVTSYNQHRAELVIGDFKKIDGGSADSGNKRVFPSSRLLGKQDIIDYLRSYLKRPNKFPLFVYSWGRLFEAAIIKNNKLYYDINLRTFEDVAFNLDYLKYVKELFFLDEPVYNHLIYNNYSSAAMSWKTDPEELFGYRRALEKAFMFLKSSNAGGDPEKEVGHAYVSYTIIQLIRCCGQISEKNKKNTIKFVKKLVKEPELRRYLKFYSPAKGDSRIIPLLIRLRLTALLILFCRYKAHKRYRDRKVTA